MLKILGGKHMVPRSSVQVLGSAPFHDTGLTASGQLSYIGWQLGAGRGVCRLQRALAGEVALLWRHPVPLPKILGCS